MEYPAKGEPMQRTVVVLQGRGNSGKTTTIGVVWKLLKKRPGVIMRRDRRHGQGFREIRCAILEVDGVLVLCH
jgi:ABC-type proline/glycine betaine transport system ATPase subunit